jgi:SAM-dependent methyltransferase
LRLVAIGPDPYRFCQCRACSLITVVPLPTQAELSAFYDGFLFGRPNDDEFDRKRTAILDDAQRILADIRSAGAGAVPLALLDWGGGTGLHSGAFADLGCDVTMIDIDPQACQYARDKFPGRFRVINADPLCHAFAERFDVVFCNQVIEHYRDPNALLDALRPALRPGGLAIITTPNQQCKEFLFRRGWWMDYLRMAAQGRWKLLGAMGAFLRAPWICCDPPRHLHAFNRRSLRVLVEGRGFAVVRCFGEYGTRQYYSPTFQWDWKVRRLLSIPRFLRNVADYAGIELLGLLAPDGRWGSNLVAFVTPESSRSDNPCDNRS